MVCSCTGGSCFAKVWRSIEQRQTGVVSSNGNSFDGAHSLLASWMSCHDTSRRTNCNCSLTRKSRTSTAFRDCITAHGTKVTGLKFHMKYRSFCVSPKAPILRTIGFFFVFLRLSRNWERGRGEGEGGGIIRRVLNKRGKQFVRQAETLCFKWWALKNESYCGSTDIWSQGTFRFIGRRIGKLETIPLFAR